MLIQNININENHNNYKKIISEQLGEAQDIKLLVSYVMDSALSLLATELQSAMTRAAKLRIICSLDMDITSPTALKELIDLGAEVKHYAMKRGTFHPKVWVFTGAAGRKTCLIGSANFSSSALLHNVEAGMLINDSQQAETIAEVEKFFDYLWNSEEATGLDVDFVESLIEYRKNKQELIKRQSSLVNLPSQPRPEVVATRDDKLDELIMEFIYSWIRLGESRDGVKGSRDQKQAWRGWYIVPDHGYLDDDRMARLQQYCAIMNSAGKQILDISPASKDLRFREILDIYRETLSRAKHKMDLRSLFVRQDKNYLINLNFCYQPNKSSGSTNQNALALSHYGEQLAVSRNIAEMKSVYTAAINERRHYGIPMLEAAKQILTKYQQLDFHEFSLFVKHILCKEDLNMVMEIIDSYRSLPLNQQEVIIYSAQSRFDEILSPQATGVLMNYNKNVRHTMSALGWCESMQYKDEVLSLL